MLAIPAIFRVVMMLAREATRFQDWLISFFLLVWYAYLVIDFVTVQSSETETARHAVYAAMMPVWASAGQAVGLWTGLAGAVLLVLGSRMSILGFVASLVGFGAWSAYVGFIRPMPDLVPADYALMLAAAIVGLCAVMFSNALADRGVLN